jgi:rod shape-determining protein MreD
VIALDAAKAGALLFAAVILQVSILASFDGLGGAPDLVLVTVVCVALLRGAVWGAVGGFAAGLLVDTATLETLGVTSLLLTLAGYWTGRYGETTGRDRSHVPFFAVAAVTALYALAALVLHFMLGAHPSARVVLLEALPPSALLNVLLTAPVYALCRRLLRPKERADRMREVRLLG